MHINNGMAVLKPKTGSGTHGTIYKAVSLEDRTCNALGVKRKLVQGQIYAVKEIKDYSNGSKRNPNKFRKSAQILSEFFHPGILNLYEFHDYAKCFQTLEDYQADQNPDYEHKTWMIFDFA